VTAMSPDLYIQSNGGEERIGVVVLATWICYGDTSEFRAICPMPAPRSPKFKAGDEVQVRLKKHITMGWKGKVELAYFADSLGANVYGVRFADRKNVYARYFEKDLQPATAAPRGEPPK
jgi:hypothetical protein